MSQDSRLLVMERRKALRGLERWLETPMFILAFVWLGLLIVELIWGLGPVLEGLGTLIWVIFILDAGVRLGSPRTKACILKRTGSR